MKKKLTEMYGKHLVCLGAIFSDTIPISKITGNSAFYEYVNCEDDMIHIGATKISNEFDEINVVDGVRKYRLEGRTSLETTFDRISMIERVNEPTSFHMVEYEVFEKGHLYVTSSNMKNGRISVVSCIFDERGIELQRDDYSSSIPKELERMIELNRNNLSVLQEALQTYFHLFIRKYSLGEKPEYRSVEDYHYLGYQRNPDYIELVKLFTDYGSSDEMIRLSNGLRRISVSGGVPRFATAEELAQSIALEESMGVRHALMEYTRHRGVTSYMVDSMRLEKK